MADYSEHYNLKKPLQEDFYNVDDFNDNADKIDAALYAAEQKLGQAAQESTLEGVKTDVTGVKADVADVKSNVAAVSNKIGSTNFPLKKAKVSQAARLFSESTASHKWCSSSLRGNAK